jgi:RNA polymerase sigma-70 factor (sigma-E family)
VTDVAPRSQSVTFEEVDGFTAFYRRHLGEAVRLAYLLCGSQSQAEEAVADAFARLYPRWLAGSAENWPGYLKRAVVNEIHNRRRHRRVEAREEQRRTVALKAGRPEDAIADRQLVMAALAQLPPRQRAAIVLRYYADLSEAETAATLGVSVGSVKSSVSRGLSRLRDVLEEG